MTFTNAFTNQDQFGTCPHRAPGPGAVASGGAGGVIDPVTGLYYAPATRPGHSDTIQLKYNDISGFAIVSATATITITGSAIPDVTVTKAGSPGESGNTGTYTFTRDMAQASALTVNFNMSGTATRRA